MANNQQQQNVVHNNRTDLSQTIKGQVWDFHPMYLQDGMYAFAQNAVVEGFDGSGFPVLQNEPSNILAVSFPAGFKVVGNVNIIEQQRIIWMLFNPTTGASEIGETLNPGQCRKYVIDTTGSCDDCQSVNLFEKQPLETITQVACASYRTIQSDTCLNFSDKTPVNSIQYNILPCTLQIFFTDDDNNRRWLEFNYINDDPTQGLIIRPMFYEIIGFEPTPCDEPIFGTHLDCNALNVQPDITTPCIEFLQEVGGGSLLAGVYQFFVSMSDINGNKLTSFLSSTNTIPVFTKVITTATNYQTDRSIKLKIDNLDITGVFQYYNLAVAKTIDNVTSFFLVGTFPVTQNTVTYTGNNQAEIKLTETDIFTLYPYYTTAGSVAKSNGILFWANVTESVKPNFQRVANNILLNWQTIAIPEVIYNDPIVFSKYRGHMRDEVYPYGIQFIFDTGEESNAYHIPGRASVPSDLTPVDNNDSIKENNCVDCGSSTPGTQVIATPGGAGDCTTTPVTPPLNPNNAHSSISCPLIPFTDTGCTPVVIDHPPIINAGPDQTITYVGFVSLNGSATPVPPNLISSVLWTQLSGPNEVTIANPITLNTTFTNINAGTYVFQLCVEDNMGNISVDTVTYTINVSVNVPPIADPGSDQLVTLPITSATLNGSGSSDPDGSIVSYVWSQLSGPNTAVIGSPTAVLTTVSGLIIGTYQFQLTVTDNRGCSSSGTMFLYVIPDPCSSAPSCSILMYPVNGSLASSFSLVNLQWSASNCAVSYDVYLKLSTDVSYTLVGNSTTTNFSVTSLTPNSVYDWYVIPKNGIGQAVGCDVCFFTFATPIAGSGVTCEKPRWQVYNTATILGGDLSIYNGCNESCYQFGAMSYWESTERYPINPPGFDIWGDLCGQPIRHHKFPDSLVTHIHDNQNGVLNYFGSNVIYVLGVKVDHDSIRASIAAAVTGGIITQADANHIVGYRIVRGNRFDNKSVVAKGLIFDVNNYQRKSGGTNFDEQPIYFSNYPFNDTRSNPFITDNFDNYSTHNTPVGPDLPFIKSNRYTFHSPDTHFNQVLPGTMLKLETVEYGQSESYYSLANKQAKQRFLSNVSYDIAFAAGLVAAILSLIPPNTKQYTVKGDVVSALGLASGEWGPYLPYQTGTGAATIVEQVADASMNPFQIGNITAATEVTTTTMQGRGLDIFNPVYILAYQPILSPLIPFLAPNFLANLITTALQEANIVIDLIKSLTPYRDWCVQYQGIGNYNAYKTVFNDTGNKIRQIDSYSYLDSNNTFINETSQTIPGQNAAIKYNNFDRESSLYLRYLGIPVPDAGQSSGIVDTSRTTLGNSEYGCTLNKKQYNPISAYYASIKNFVPDQYGTIYNIQYLPTDSCSFDINTPNTLCRGVYGGDTFINRFALKIKVPYFLADTFNLPNGTDFGFDTVPNLAVPRNYYDSTAGVGTNLDNIGFSTFTPSGIATLLGRPKSIRDCTTNKFFYQNGYIYLYHYGIPYFLVESDYNVNYRHGINNQEGDFYPNQKDLNFWLQQENVLISEDNTYFYNNTYSKQNKETFIGIDPPTFEPGRECRVVHPNRIIYSDTNNFLVYKANNFYDNPLSNGKITSIEGIENQTLLIRTENNTSIIKTILRLPVDGQTVQIGNGSLFSNPPQDFATTTLGYIGSQHKAILHTEYGHIWADAKRGQIFNVGMGASGMEEISKDGMKNWFKENLPFRVLRDFQNMPEQDADNNYLGMGITMSFDKRFNRFLITKLDWKRTDPTVQYDPILKEFFKIISSVRTVIRLGDPKYFKDCSWTQSYNFFTKSWVSFHSYKPNYYIDFIDFFSSGVNGTNSNYWVHDLYNGSFQVFYGKIYPFIVEPVIRFDQQLKQLNSVEFDTEVRRYSNEFDYTVKKGIPGFNKAIIYNDWYNSGLLNLSVVDKNNFTLVGKYPIRNFDNWNIEVATANYKWRFNQFFALNKDNSEIPMWIYSGNNEEKKLNLSAFNYKKNDYSLARLKGQWFKERFINDSLSNYKIIFKFSINNQTTQYK